MATVKEFGTQLWFQLQALRDADRKPRYNEDTKRFLVTVEAGIDLQVKCQCKDSFGNYFLISKTCFGELV